jgi:hypothetical protein
MPSPVPLPLRQALVLAHEQGVDAPALAGQFGLPLRTTYHLLQQARLHQGDVLAPAYRAPPKGPRGDAAVVRQARALRQQHPSWGAPLIRLILARHFPEQTLPAARTLQRWLGPPPLKPPLGRGPSTYQRASAVHETWQVDAADRLRLADGTLACWLRSTDECSGAVLKTWVFPGVWNALPARRTQEALRQQFSHWGLPARLRLDNGAPWGNWNDLPTALALWLVGLGIELHFNDPGKPQHNGVVEKSQDTGQRWAEPATAASPAELEGRLDEMDCIQRQEYPSFQGRSRLAVFPQLIHSGRAYSPEWEQRTWSLARAQQYLAGHIARRHASRRQGQVSLYNRNYCLGVLHKTKTVFVQYDSHQNTWLFADDQGRLLRQFPAPEITRERILALDISAP